eukprot:scaffold64048_cov18-Tisochrysis_lutea.AAC.1
MEKDSCKERGSASTGMNSTKYANKEERVATQWYPTKEITDALAVDHCLNQSRKRRDTWEVSFLFCATSLDKPQVELRSYEARPAVGLGCKESLSGAVHL